MANDTCAEAALMVRRIGYLFPSIASICSSFGSFIFLFLILKKFTCKMYYHFNAKTLITLNISTFAAISLLTIASFGTMLVNLNFAKTDCDVYFLTDNCSILRRMFLCCFVLVTNTHAALVIERLWATIRLSRYEKDGRSLGVLLGALSIVFSMFLVTVVTMDEDKNELLTSCLAFSSSPTIGDSVFKMFRYQVVIESLVCVCYVFLYRYNKNRVRTQLDSELNDKFQAFENMAILKQMGPLLVTCSVVIGTYIISVSIVREYKSTLSLTVYKMIAVNLFIIPHLSFVSMGLLFTIFKRSAKAQKQVLQSTVIQAKDHKDLYMRNTVAQWDQEYEKRGRSGSPTQTQVTSC